MVAPVWEEPLRGAAADPAIIALAGIDRLRTFLDGVTLPVLAFLRDTQNYVHLAAHGLTLWDVASTRFDRDREQWAPITSWIDA